MTLGARPDILLVENDQNLVRRRALAVRAEQDVAGAANALSLYLRDEAGAPVTVSEDRLPEDAGALAALSIATTRAGPVERPDYRAVLARIDQATSRLALAENDLSLGQRSRFLRDQITVEVQGIVIAVGAAERLAAIADEERQLAERLATAERRRFELGSADFFLVNQREETATDARVRLVDAQARIASARAELAAATADREALQLIR